MNIGEIINEVDTVWAPNNVPIAIKCRWLTQEQWYLLRRVRLPGTTDIIATVAGESAYPLPPDCKPDLIQHVVLVGLTGSEVEYRFRPRSEIAVGRWWSLLPGNVLWLSDPPGETDASLVLFYVATPLAFSEANLTETPVIPQEYHEYLVKKLAARCAKANAAAGGTDRDILLANNYESEAAEILQRLIIDFSPNPASGFQMEANW